MTVQPIQIRTKRLLLMPFRVKDMDDVFGYASDEGSRTLVRGARMVVG